MVGMFGVTTPRNDPSPGVGQWDVRGAYKYVSEAYGGYHFNVNHGLNVDAGIFVSYIGLLNNFRYGLTRQSQAVEGNSTAPWIQFRGINDNSANAPNNFTYSHAFTAPVHNLVDDLSWKKGNHSIAIGTNIRFIRNPRNSLANSFSDGVTNASWLTAAGIANTGTFMDPALSNFPAVLPAFNNSYDYPLIALIGSVPQGDARYNYDKQGNLLPQGTPIQRHWAADVGISRMRTEPVKKAPEYRCFDISSHGWMA